MGLRASRGSEYRRLGSSRKSRTGSKPLRFFWITPSLVPMLASQGDGRKKRRRRKEGKRERGSCKKDQGWEERIDGEETEQVEEIQEGRGGKVESLGGEKKGNNAGRRKRE